MCVILSSIHREKSVDGTPERDMYYISPVFIFAYYPHYRDVSVVLCIPHTTKTQNGSTLRQMPSQQPIISTSTPVDCCIIHLTSLHFPLALVYHLSNFRMLMLLGYITFIYPTNCIDVNIELYRVSIHNHRMTTGSNVLPTESFIPSHTHIHSSCCYLVDCLYNHVH